MVNPSNSNELVRKEGLFDQIKAKYPEDLDRIDGLVHDMKAAEASNINNQGIDEQLEYLYATCGEAWLRSNLLEDDDGKS